MHWISIAAAAAALLGASAPALGSPDVPAGAPRPDAPRAAYASESELPGEGAPHVLDAAVLGSYAHVADPERLGGIAGMGGLALRNRLLIGRRIAYAAGLDGTIGASPEGVVYQLTGHLVGVGLRFGDAGLLAISGGIGIDGAAGAVPFALRAPVEASLAVDLGPVRVQPWAVAAWTGDDAREDGVSWWSAVDEVEAGVLLRLARQRHYWSTASAGGGLAVGVVYRELMDTSTLAVVVGLDLTGAR